MRRWVLTNVLNTEETVAMLWTVHPSLSRGVSISHLQFWSLSCLCNETPQLLVFKPWGGKVKPEPTDTGLYPSLSAPIIFLRFSGFLGLAGRKKAECLNLLLTSVRFTLCLIPSAFLFPLLLWLQCNLLSQFPWETLNMVQAILRSAAFFLKCSAMDR